MPFPAKCETSTTPHSPSSDIIGRAMGSRTLEGQRVEVQVACGVLNTMTRLGMPDSYRVE